MATKGVIYILTNPAFPEYVKIGYANNLEQRMKDFNQSEALPFAFRVYAIYEVCERLTDKKLHDLIDTLNPDLRTVENFDGKERKREFYAMSKEDAYKLFEKSYDLYSLFWGLNMHLIDLGGVHEQIPEFYDAVLVKKTDAKSDKKANVKSDAACDIDSGKDKSAVKRLGDWVKNKVNCCIE